MAEKKKKNRLSDVRCSEVAIVDRGAIGVPFMLYKRDEGGNEDMELEELKKALEKANSEKVALEKRIRILEKKVGMSNPKEGESLADYTDRISPSLMSDQDMTEEEAKVACKENYGKMAKVKKVKKAEMAEDVFVAELQKMVDEIKECDEEIAKVGRTFNSKNEAAIQSAYEALGKLLEVARKRKSGSEGDSVSKALEEYNIASPERKKEMETQLVDVLKKAGVDVTPYLK